MAEQYTLWPTWQNGSTGRRGPFADEAEARYCAANLVLTHGQDLVRLTLQRPDGTKEELLKGDSR